MARKQTQTNERKQKISASRSSKVGANPGRIPDKLPMRAPRRPEAARYEQGRRTGAKKRLGR